MSSFKLRFPSIFLSLGAHLLLFSQPAFSKDEPKKQPEAAASAGHTSESSSTKTTAKHEPVSATPQKQTLSRFALRFNFEPGVLYSPFGETGSLLAGFFPFSIGPTIYAIDTCGSSRPFCIDWSFQAELWLSLLSGDVSAGPDVDQQRDGAYIALSQLLHSNPGVFFGGRVGSKVHLFFSAGRKIGWTMGGYFEVHGIFRPAPGTLIAYDNTNTNRTWKLDPSYGFLLYTGVVFNIGRHVSAEVGVAWNGIVQTGVASYVSIPISVQYRF